MDSRHDVAVMRDDDKLKAQGEAIVKGAIAYLGGKVTIPNDTKTGGIIVENKPAPKPSKKTIAQMADEVIAQKHGNGHDNRRKSLGISAAEYEKVCAEVNRKSGVGSSKPVTAKPKKSIAQMATEVINNQHGNGHENRRQSLGISQAEYEKVRAEVNRRAGGGSAAAPSKSTKPAVKSGEGIVDYMNRAGMDSSMANRKRLAQQHGISNYRGTAAQNSRLLTLISR